MYNKIINISEMNKIREYFITNQNKTVNVPNINNYIMDINPNIDINSTSLFQPYNKKDKTYKKSY
jgi:hypothetical protein